MTGCRLPRITGSFLVLPQPTLSSSFPGPSYHRLKGQKEQVILRPISTYLLTF